MLIVGVNVSSFFFFFYLKTRAISKILSCWILCSFHVKLPSLLFVDLGGLDLAYFESWDSLLVERPTHYQKVASSNPSRRGGRIFFPRVKIVCWLFLVSVPPPVLPQWHLKDPGHSVISAGGRLHLNTHTPLTQWSQSGFSMPLCRHSVDTYQEMSSYATRQETLGHSHLSSLSHCWLIMV